MIKSVKSKSGLYEIEVQGHHSTSIHKRQVLLSKTAYGAVIRRHLMRIHCHAEFSAGLV